MSRIPAVLARGGTSRGLIIESRHLANLTESDRDLLIARLVGSPDPTARQVDGVGGGNVTTSKVVTVAISSQPDCDIDYTYHQVDVVSGDIDRRGTCGNLLTAAAQFVLDQGLMAAVTPSTRVRIYDANTGQRIWVDVPVRDGQVCYSGDVATHGVPGSGAGAVTTFLNPGGALTGRLYPTECTVDMVHSATAGCRVTLIDAVNPVALVHASDLPQFPGWGRAALMADRSLLDHLEAVRHWAAVRCGLASSVDRASAEAKALPFVGILWDAFMAPIAGTEPPDQGTALVRIMSGGLMHGALPLSAGIATAAAVSLRRLAVNTEASTDRVVLAHPSGTLTVEVGSVATAQGKIPHLTHASITQTGRPIMIGELTIPESMRPVEATTSPPYRTESAAFER